MSVRSYSQIVSDSLLAETQARLFVQRSQTPAQNEARRAQALKHAEHPSMDEAQRAYWRRVAETLQ